MRAPASAAPCTAPHSASALASVPPLVKITSLRPRAGQRGDLLARVFDHRRAPRGLLACTEEGLPPIAKRVLHRGAAPRARSGEVAL